MYIYIYILVYVCVFVCVCVRACVLVCTCVCMYVTMYVCVYVCMYVSSKPWWKRDKTQVMNKNKATCWLTSSRTNTVNCITYGTKGEFISDFKDYVLLVTVMVWYHTKRPVHCGIFSSILHSHLSPNHSLFIHQRSLVAPDTYWRSRAFARNVLEFNRRSISVTLRMDL
jgi:hypothetical protein